MTGWLKALLKWVAPIAGEAAKKWVDKRLR